MDNFVGALLAAGAAWVSIVLASAVPVSRDRLPALRLAGGISLGVVALVVVGLPIPAWVGLAVIGLGISYAALPARWRRGWGQTDAATEVPKDP